MEPMGKILLTVPVIKQNSMSNNVCDDGAGGTRYCDITGQDMLD
ncbi:hypothetical protein [Shewanella morhuae]|nr:hypothetical protein [Shewanella morhuae]